VFLCARAAKITFLREYFDPVRAAKALDAPIVGLQGVGAHFAISVTRHLAQRFARINVAQGAPGPRCANHRALCTCRGLHPTAVRSRSARNLMTERSRPNRREADP